MARTGPIVIIEDDLDDQEITQNALHELGVKNDVRFFENPKDALDYLYTTTERPLIIISDVNLPVMNGIEFKRAIDEDSFLRSRSIPFVFISTSVSRTSVDTAYKEMTVQGFFEKSHSYEDVKNTLRIVVEYWINCKHPNSDY